MIRVVFIVSHQLVVGELSDNIYTQIGKFFFRSSQKKKLMSYESTRTVVHDVWVM